MINDIAPNQIKNPLVISFGAHSAVASISNITIPKKVGIGSGPELTVTDPGEGGILSTPSVNPLGYPRGSEKGGLRSLGRNLLQSR